MRLVTAFNAACADKDGQAAAGSRAAVGRQWGGSGVAVGRQWDGTKRNQIEQQTAKTDALVRNKRILSQSAGTPAPIGLRATQIFAGSPNLCDPICGLLMNGTSLCRLLLPLPLVPKTLQNPAKRKTTRKP